MAHSFRIVRTLVLCAFMTIGFVGETTGRDVSRGELTRRGLPDIWHTEFQEDFVCNSEIGGRIVIPKLFISDGASTPRWLWSLPFVGVSDTDPIILYPSFVHDLLYSVHGKLPDGRLTRDQCDNIIREQMKAIGAPAIKYDGVYRALHLFGQRGWNRKTPAYKLINTFYRTNLLSAMHA